ncbi:DUF308 domain-containing protein [Pseudonocardia bannensis]|uniref:DUF308 domain-containing protein n=1 Tax=Pseudonocardia bannensis TaxID=630973 RepID=A0A848DR91_9PSEU|nr:DUF308 domain-containing protein [Pseudonocardia bannensis]NMH95367.1 DUF308 domain-containing protein [Pseudonocardia bannensis]
MSPDPEERRGRDVGGPEPDPAGDDFDRIVASWRSEGQVPQWPADDRMPEDDRAPGERVRDDRPRAEEPPPGPPRAVSPIAEEDDHFVPPEPPPLPRLGPPAAVGLVLLVLGLLLCVAPGVVGISSSYGLPLGLLALAAGLGWLLLRLWPTTPRPGDGEDDGAIL